MQIPDWTGQALDLAQAYAQPMLFGAGAVGALIGVTVVWRFFRTGQAHTRVGFLAVVLATGFAAEGMWEVATDVLHLHPVMALGLFGMFEVVMVSQGLLAKHKLSQTPPGDVRRHMNFVWAVAAGSGIVAAAASTSVPEFLLRLFAPAVGAGIWWMGITADKPAGAVQATSWIWTPRRIGIRLGLVKPGQQDLVKVDRDQRIDAITVTAHRLHHGSPRLARWRKAKLRRLALQADDAMVTEAQRRVARVHRIEKLTDPSAAPVGEVAAEDRELMAELTIAMRTATTGLRAQVDQIRAADADTRMVHGVRMPAAIADQIPDQIPQDWLDRFRSNRVDQPAAGDLDQTRTTPADQTPDQPGPRALVHTPAAPVDQTPTSGTIPAARPAPTRRTTVRVEQVRPISPAPAGEIPPRVHAMVQALREQYPDQVPGRRTVMDRMGWTSAGDAQTAINLVRAERTKTTEEN